MGAPIRFVYALAMDGSGQTYAELARRLRPKRQWTIAEEVVNAQMAIDGALGRGESGVLEWIKHELLVAGTVVAAKRGQSRAELEASCERGDLFGLRAKGELWVPLTLAQVPQEHATAVCQAIRSFPVHLRLAFWLRRHGTHLEGRTVFEAIKDGKVDQVIVLAGKWRAFLDGLEELAAGAAVPAGGSSVDERVGRRIEANTGTAQSLGRPVTSIVDPVWLAAAVAGALFVVLAAAVLR